MSMTKKEAVGIIDESIAVLTQQAKQQLDGDDFLRAATTLRGAHALKMAMDALDGPEAPPAASSIYEASLDRYSLEEKKRLATQAIHLLVKLFHPACYRDVDGGRIDPCCYLYKDLRNELEESLDQLDSINSHEEKRAMLPDLLDF